MERYRDFLPITAATPQVTLLEGSTPLIPSRVIGRGLGLERLYFKYEGANPTGSFKDRGMAMAVARALQDGAHTLMCASTGNTSASAAAYAARYGLRALVVVPAGGVALGKLGQAIAHGAVVVVVRATFDVALDVVRDLAQRPGIALVNSVNPYRIEGQKTAAFELCDDLAKHRRASSFRSGTPATSPPTGVASKTIAPRAARGACLCCTGRRRPGRRPW